MISCCNLAQRTLCFSRAAPELSGQFSYTDDKVSAVLKLFLELTGRHKGEPAGTSRGKNSYHAIEESENDPFIVAASLKTFCCWSFIIKEAVKQAITVQLFQNTDKAMVMIWVGNPSDSTRMKGEMANTIHCFIHIDSKQLSLLRYQHKVNLFHQSSDSPVQRTSAKNQIFR